jgi:ankyrin repeat protein
LASADGTQLTKEIFMEPNNLTNRRIATAVGLCIVAMWCVACGTSKDQELVQAAKQGNTTVIEKLLRDGADVNAKDEEYQSTALMWAAHNGHTQAVRMLIDNGAEINARRFKGETALWFAAQKGQLAPLKALVEYGADATIPGRDGDTALNIARKNGHNHLVAYLQSIDVLD